MSYPTESKRARSFLATPVGASMFLTAIVASGVAIGLLWPQSQVQKPPLPVAATVELLNSAASGSLLVCGGKNSSEVVYRVRGHPERDQTILDGTGTLFTFDKRQRNLLRYCQIVELLDPHYTEFAVRVKKHS